MSNSDGINRTGWSNIGGITYFLDEYEAVTGKKMYFTGDAESILQVRNERDFLRVYNQCPPLKAIVGKRAKAFNTGKTVLLNENTEKPLRGYDWLKRLLKQPNVLQNEDQFMSQQNHYIDIFGYCPVLKVYASGFEGLEEGITAIWNIPPWLFDIEYTGKLWKQNQIAQIYKTYRIHWEGEQYDIPSQNLGFIFDDGIGTDYDTNLTIPDSRLVGMHLVISNIIGAYKSRNTLITRRGALGILSNDGKENGAAIPLDPDEKENVQRDFAKYGLVGQAYQVIITDAQLKWQQMGFATKDLMLFEETAENIERLCDGYGWPIELIARGKDVTYDNKIQARKDLYQNTTIPESNSRYQQFSRILAVKGVIIRKDFSSVPVLQTDMKTKAEARTAVNAYCKELYDLDMMTRNEWLAELGLPLSNNPDFDKLKSELGKQQSEDDELTDIDKLLEDEETINEDEE
jgi:hypothetical protein